MTSMIISGEPPADLDKHHKRIYPGEQSLPLTDKGQQKFREASRAGDKKDQLIGEGILLTGLKSGTFAHLREGWLEKDENIKKT